MNLSKRGMLSIGVFVFGCATGGAASQYVATAKAELPAGATAWEYTCFREDHVNDIVVLANKAGSEGWELAASSLSGGADASDPIWCFKRRR
jgi:hypothetical protein